MDFNTALVRWLPFAVGAGMITPLLGHSSRVGPAARVAMAVGAEKAEKAEEAPTIEGIEIEREGGGFLGLAIEGNAFVLRFYDKEKKPEPADAVRAIARWNPPRTTGGERAILNPSGPDALRSPAVVRPPHRFHVFLTLVDGQGDAIDTHTVNLRKLDKD